MAHDQREPIVQSPEESPARTSAPARNDDDFVPGTTSKSEERPPRILPMPVILRLPGKRSDVPPPSAA
jgi:hypothetical protein